jgi:tetratricopeptide (TPR) repeat protein
MVCVIVMTLSSVAALAQISASGTSTGSVDGTVVDAASRPLPGAIVVLTDKSKSVHIETATRQDGSFVFPSVPSGTYIVSAGKSGFRNTNPEASVFLSSGEQKHLRIILQNSDTGAPANPSSQAMALDDKPNFIVAGVLDWTAAGGHGSDSNLRASEKLTRETLALRENGAAAEPKREATAVTHAELIAERRKLQKLLAKQNSANIHNRLGDIEEQLGDPLQAVRQYEIAVQLDPSESNYFDWGTELLLHRAVKPAVDVLTKGASKFPSSERMLAGLGAALYASGAYNDAAERVCAASDLKPEDPGPYLFLGQMDKAAPEPLPCVEPELARFAAVQPKNALVNYYYALSLWKRNRRLDDARVSRRVEELLEKSAALDPKFGEAYLQLGILYSAQNNYELAIAAYTKAIEAQAQLAEAHYRLAQAYKRSGEPAKAEQEFQIYHRIEKQEAADIDRQRREVRQFLIVLKDIPSPTSAQ